MTYQTPKEILLRDATTDDRGALGALHTRSWRANYSKELRPTSLGDVRENDMRNQWATRSFARPELIIVAEVTDERRHHVTSIAGFICVLADNDPPLIDNLHVVSEWPSHGLGATLVQSALERLSHKGFEAAVLGVLASNTRARQFYARIGGQDTGSSEEVLWVSRL